MMEKSTESSEEDSVSLKSNGKTPTKENLGMVNTFRNSFRRVTEKSPLLFGSKAAKVKSKGDNDSGLLPPPSPSLSAGSPVMSPLKSIGGYFPEDEAETVSQKSKGISRSKTDPNMTRFSDSLLTRGALIRRSLGFGNKKDKSSRQEQLVPVCEGPAEERRGGEEKQEEEEVWEEVEETYTLQELPHTPLSVMQINKLIEMEVLEEAHLNLLALRLEFQQDSDRCGVVDSPMDLAKKEKDLNLLYGELRNKLNTIVRDSNSLPSRNKALLVPVSRIIQEEERRAEEPGGLPDSWVQAWREAVSDGVRVKINNVHLDHRDQNASWLAVHLGLLGKTIVEDLENVKKDLRWSYPPSFKVFSVYLESYTSVTAQHLKKLEKEVTELKDLFHLLEWIINRYNSERVMGSLSLLPDIGDESTELQLEQNFLKQLKEKYCCRVKGEMRFSLNNIIELEKEDLWSKNKEPEEDEDKLLHSQIPMDIWTKVKGNAVNSRKIDAELEQRVTASCLEELKQFPKRFETELRRLCSSQPLWTKYQITYINSFTALQQHMEGYHDSCPHEVEGFSTEAKGLVYRLLHDMENQFTDHAKPYLRRMMTRKWLTNNEDFEELHRQTQKLSQHCALMRSPYAQELASRLHYHVVREFVGQLMKNIYSCKNRKHEKAARKISEQWNKLRDLFEDMWLHPVGDLLSDIIKQKDKTQIKNHLQPLVEQCPDFSKKHLVAVLYFRGLMRGREHQLILQKLTELKRKLGNAGDKRHVLFGDMQVTVNTDCLSNLPFSCLSFLLPDN